MVKNVVGQEGLNTIKKYLAGNTIEIREYD